MAGAGYKLFNTGDVLTAAQVNTYLQEQVVMVFASATARTTALSGVLAEGMVSYLKDTNATEVYDGSAWVGIGNSGDITGVTAGTGISGGGTSGTVTITNSMATEITAAGDIIVGTGSGTFDNLPIGTTGQVLTADTTVSPYKVKWASAGSSGALTLISTTALSAVSTQSFDNVFSSTYNTYKVFMSLYGTGTQVTQFRFRASSSDNSSANYYGATRTTNSTGTASTDDSRNAGTIIVIGSNNTSTSTKRSFSDITIYNPYSTTMNKALNYSYVRGDGTYGGEGWAYLDVSGTAFDGFSIFGNTFTGTISIYGVSK